MEKIVLSPVDFVNLIAALASILLAIVALWLSLRFFFASKASEIKAAEILVAIDHNVSTLNTINNDLLKKLVDHLADSNSQMINRTFSDKVERAQSATPVNVPPTQPPANGDAGPPVEPIARNIRDHILKEIRHLTTNTGRATAIELTNRLETDFSFTSIYNELMRMLNEGAITWEGAPKPPEAHAMITIVDRQNPTATSAPTIVTGGN